ncbi:MAG: universal stress protein [Burkholderiaceae bacterium]|jgi:nucleotide-binding universal stress UspA family protein|nr:universal stress protein [Burkholderiaceae bacterium]MDH5208273.1 universal stress protein [Burkholderiaceae bacterium]
MFKRILVPTDGSELSEKAIRAAVDLAHTLKASLVGMTTLEPYSYSNLSEYRPETLDDYEARMDKAGAERLARIADAATQAGLPVETVTVKSFSPYEAIIDTAKASKCDLIVMASHGRRGLNAVLLGSETQKVLTHTSIPVMVFR